MAGYQTGVSGVIEEVRTVTPGQPTSLLLVGLNLWPSWLKRWLTTPSMLSAQVQNLARLLVPRRYTKFSVFSFYQRMPFR